MERLTDKVLRYFIFKPDSKHSIQLQLFISQRRWILLAANTID